jgi:hypothetical protein
VHTISRVWVGGLGYAGGEGEHLLDNGGEPQAPTSVVAAASTGAAALIRPAACSPRRYSPTRSMMNRGPGLPRAWMVSASRASVTRHFAKITIQVPSTSVCQLQAVDVFAVVTDIHSGHGQEYAQHVNADAVITTTTISDLLAGKIKNATVATNPSARTLDIGIFGGFLQIDERASLVGGSAPSSLQSTIYSRLTVQHSLSGLPGHLAPSSLKITDQGIEVGLAAGPTQLEMGTSGKAAKPKCLATKSKL